eukprot:SAG31_NODE_844_length_11549_cov_2.985852_13_plen_128_part_00
MLWSQTTQSELCLCISGSSSRASASALLFTIIFCHFREEWLLATLRHKLVDSYAESAAHFRSGVLQVVPATALSLLTAAELGQRWCGLGIDDTQFLRWKASASSSPLLGECVDWFWDLMARMTQQER